MGRGETGQTAGRKLDLVGGSKEDHADAREWLSLFSERSANGVFCPIWSWFGSFVESMSWWGWVEQNNNPQEKPWQR